MTRGLALSAPSSCLGWGRPELEPSPTANDEINRACNTASLTTPELQGSENLQAGEHARCGEPASQGGQEARCAFHTSRPGHLFRQAVAEL